MKVGNYACNECERTGTGMWFTDGMFSWYLCAECIRIAGTILARAEKDAAKDDVPAPEGERK